MEGRFVNAGTRLAAIVALALLAAAAAPSLESQQASAACGGRKVFPAQVDRGPGPPPLAIGDSVMLGAAPQLAGAGFEVDVQGCRDFEQGLRAMRSRPLPRAVVVMLGTNQTITTSSVRRAVEIVGPRRLLALVTPVEVGGRAGGDATTVRAAGRRWPERVLVLDWAATSAAHPGWTAGDGIHLAPEGARGLTRLLGKVFRVVVPAKGAWTGLARSGPIALTVGAARRIVAVSLVTATRCLGARRAQFRDRARIGWEGGFAAAGKGGGLAVSLRGRFDRRGRARGMVRVRGPGCDGGRPVVWSASRGRPSRASGSWNGVDGDGNRLAFSLPQDRLSLRLEGDLRADCSGFAESGEFAVQVVPIRRGAFDATTRLADGSTVQVRGRFVASRSATGTWRRSLPASSDEPCDTGRVRWSARR